MSRNPYARSLRAKPQQVIGDKREKTYRQHLDDTLKEEVPERFKRLLDQLK
jgi:hypothetical protein